MVQERRKDVPLLHREWTAWLDDHFNPHVEREEEAYRKLDKVTTALFGDGNGDEGISKNVKTLMCTSNRIEYFFDGVAKVWGILVKAVIGIAAIVALSKTLGWW